MNQVYCQKYLLIANVLLLYFFSGVFFIEANPATPLGLKEAALEQFENHCFDCHDGDAKKGGLDLVSLLGKANFDGSLIFEHLITAKMPPKNKKQPALKEKQLMLDWLAQRQAENAPKPYRRLSRHEFVQSVNDLLGRETGPNRGNSRRPWHA